jgi:replicative DNA helicase
MEHCRAAERALVAALVMGEVDPTELSGRLHPLDFTDPAASACYAAALAHGRCGPLTDLPQVLRNGGALRSDGYPISELLAWLPTLPVPAHPQTWAALVIAGSLGRVVHACGTRLLQAVDPDGSRPEAGRVLTVAAAQRATLHGALQRWDALPRSWRDTMPAATQEPALPPAAAEPVAPVGQSVELEVLAGLVAAPALLDRMDWLCAEDFTDPAIARIFTTVRQLHTSGRPVDLVTLAAAVSPAAGVATAACASVSEGERGPVEIAADLRPHLAVPTTVPFLARRILEDAAVRRAHAAGEDLVRLAGASGSAGGLGRPLLERALSRLEVLRPYTQRLERATRPAPERAIARGVASSRPVPEPRAASALHRCAG